MAAQAPPQVTGRYVVQEVSAKDSSSVKQMVAQCDPGDQVLGGGGGARPSASTGPEATEIARHVELVQKMPFGGTNLDIGRQGYITTAAETSGGTTGNWSLTVEAICAANPVAGHQIVTSSTGFSSASIQTTQADCPAGKSAVGTGAAVNFTPGRAATGVGLQVERTRGSGESTLAQANEQAGGYAFSWQLVDYAVCATTPLGYEIRAHDTTGRVSVALCSGTKRILDAGGVADTTFVNVVPSSDATAVLLEADRNLPSGFISAYATCATTTQRWPGDPRHLCHLTVARVSHRVGPSPQ